MPHMDREVFHKFPELPAELREEIWRCCLPYRVCELDQPFAEVIYMNPDRIQTRPCELRHTTRANSRPPMITRVCYESRSVAFKAGRMKKIDAADAYSNIGWSSPWKVEDTWQDPVRDSVHLNWDSVCDIMETASYGWPLGCLAYEATQLSGRGSLRVRVLDVEFDWPDRVEATPPASPSDSLSYPPIDKRQEEQLEDLYRLSCWRIVMRIMVVHTAFTEAAATGLFGLLGDALVQIVDVDDAARIDAYYDFAEACESRHPVTISQDFRRESAQSWRTRLRFALMREYHSERLVASCTPAIMFRLCTKMCNRSRDT